VTSSPATRATGRRALRVVSAAVGAMLLLGAPAAWALLTPPETVGELPASLAEGGDRDLFGAEDGVSSAGGPAPVGAGAAGAEPDPVGALPPGVSVGRSPIAAPAGEAADADPTVADPSAIRIDRIGVDHRIVPVGLEDDGTMEIPEDVQEIGWYDPGVRPGEPGSAVLAGHVDSRAQGRGAFFALGSLDVDDEIVLTDAEGAEQRWRVTARTRYPKYELPVDELFVWGGAEGRLVLITCGGDFDRASRHYSDNVVVLASPA
jgi:hypothetical protein